MYGRAQGKSPVPSNAKERSSSHLTVFIGLTIHTGYIDEGNEVLYKDGNKDDELQHNDGIETIPTPPVTTTSTSL